MENTILIFTILALVVAFGTYIYKFPPRSVDPREPKNDNSICSNYSNEPMHELKVNLIHKMIDGYKKNQLTFIKKEMKDDAHSIWFDLETLKKFIYQLELNTKKNDHSITSGQLGIRMYYASYPNKAEMATYPDISWFLNDPVKKDYATYHTLIMIPTIKTTIGNVDFNPLDKLTFTGKGLKNNLEKYGPQDTNASTIGLKISSFSTGAENHGGLIPPGDPIAECF